MPEIKLTTFSACSLFNPNPPLVNGLIKDEELGQLVTQKKNYKFINLRKEKI